MWLSDCVGAAILNLFWGVLTQKKRAEEALEASGMPYFIVRPGGMERPGDDYKRTHNVVLGKRDTLFGGQVRSKGKPCRFGGRGGVSRNFLEF